MEDKFDDYSTGLGDPATNGFAIVPHDDNDLTYATRWIWVGGVGAITLITIGGDTITLTAVAAGTRLDIRASRVLDTGTDATLIVGMY